jgi:tellurite methyltransferase
MTDWKNSNPPSPFVSGWVRRLARGFGARPRALDVAGGRGRHTLTLAEAGFRVTNVDADFEALRATSKMAAAAGLQVAALCADLTTMPLPVAAFDTIVVTRYLERPLFRQLRAALAPGGVLLYETFTERQLAHGRGPRSPRHLLKPGELRMLTLGMEVLFDEEVTEPEAVARIAARRAVFSAD